MKGTEDQFASALRRSRLQAGLSQEQLARRAGLHPAEVSRMERAAREPRLSMLVRLARALRVEPEKLVGDRD